MAHYRKRYSCFSWVADVTSGHLRLLAAVDGHHLALPLDVNRRTHAAVDVHLSRGRGGMPSHEIYKYIQHVYMWIGKYWSILIEENFKGNKNSVTFTVYDQTTELLDQSASPSGERSGAIRSSFILRFTNKTQGHSLSQR